MNNVDEMDELNLEPNEELELAEYEEAVRELEAARTLEEAEHIHEMDVGEDKDEAFSGEVQEAPVEILADTGARRSYWQAQSLVEQEQQAFAAAWAEQNQEHLRGA